MMVEREALQVALDMFRSPALARKVQRQPLPKNVLQVIRIAAGEAIDEKATEQIFGWTEAEVRSAAILFLQQILFDKSSSSYRVLGLTPDAELNALKDHKRALLKWLHPDRNSNRWESVLLQRVVKAADSILESRGETGNVLGGIESNAPVHVVTQPPTRRRRKPNKNFETTRVRKFLYWKEHLRSFAKRMGFFAAALLIAFLGLRVLAKSETTAQIGGIARNMLVWLK
jgi:hypothetical protein